MSDYYDSDEDNSVELKQGSSPLAPQLEPLRNSLVEKRPPYCSGVLPVLKDELILYYGKEEDSSRPAFVIVPSCSV